MKGDRIKMKKKVIASIVTAGILVIALFTFLFLPANITNEQAVDLALAHIGGGVANRAEREFEGFRRVWSVEVFYENIVHEVYIQVNSGEILGVERDFD